MSIGHQFAAAARNWWRDARSLWALVACCLTSCEGFGAPEVNCKHYRRYAELQREWE